MDLAALIFQGLHEKIKDLELEGPTFSAGEKIDLLRRSERSGLEERYLDQRCEQRLKQYMQAYEEILTNRDTEELDIIVPELHDATKMTRCNPIFGSHDDSNQ